MRERVDEERSVSLKMQSFQVKEYPAPTILFSKQNSGQILSELSDSTELICAIPWDAGIDNKFEIQSWEIKVGEKVFTGNGPLLTKELIEYFNQSNDEYVHVNVNLAHNKTGYKTAESVYLIRIGSEN